MEMTCGIIIAEAAAYVARILRGEQPSELHVEVPVKFEPVINPAWLPARLGS